MLLRWQFERAGQWWSGCRGRGGRCAGCDGQGGSGGGRGFGARWEGDVENAWGAGGGEVIG